MGVLWGKIGEGVVRYWPLTNSFFLLGVLTSVPILVKIDQEMRPWECSQTDRLTHWHTDTLTDWQTQTDFIICPMLYAIAMGQIKIAKLWFNVREITKQKLAYKLDGVKLKCSKCPPWQAHTHTWLHLHQCDRESECSQTDRLTHWHTDRQTQTDFIICPMLYAIAMGQIITVIIITTINQSIFHWKFKTTNSAASR